MKRFVLATVLVFAAAWPLVHRLVVARYDVNPWKLAGWAMYTTPRLPVLLAVFTKVGDGFTPIDTTRLSRPTRDAMRRFRVERHALGKLREPKDVAKRILDERQDLSAVVLVVQSVKLDTKTALTVSSREIFEYDRPPSLR